ncbi:MAG TPA: FadR/GntR family transcriptional regulator [Blastocatellia bacterium]|nr:FadR/GntR family transcriptional regulator [Blastocatellia bacterium]
MSSRSVSTKMFKRLGEGVTTEQVVAQIRDLIERGELRPGDRLPSERMLANRLGISRPSVRTGLRILSAMGVLRSRHGSGTFISTGPPAESQMLRLLAALHGFSSDAMFEARRILEVALAGLAAERATDEHLAMMAESVADMYASLNDPKMYLLYDMQFHRTVALASGNPIIATLMDMVTAALYESKVETIERSPDMEESAAMHRKIYQAIRARKPDEAREAMSTHLELAQKSIAAQAAADKSGNKPRKRSAPVKDNGSHRRAKAKKTRG